MSRRRLVELVLGSEQERALRQAAKAAVELTVAELSPGDGERAEELAMVVSQVFGAPTSRALMPGQATLLQALHVGVAEQLAPLGDADLTGTGKSSLALLGVPATVLAEKLTNHLVQEIRVRGASGGPLAPLADQLNHDLTHLQGQRLERLIDELRPRLHAGPTAEEPPVHIVKLPDIPIPSAPYVPRPQLLDRLRPLLLADSRGASPAVGLVGMGGVGKSTLARAVAGDDAVRAGFAEGVAWLQAGPAADPVSCQQQLAAMLEDGSPIEDAAAGRDRLRALLTGASALSCSMMSGRPRSPRPSTSVCPR